MAFDPENPLEEALKRAAEGDVLAAPQFYKLLMTTRLFVLGDAEHRPPGQGVIELNPGDKLNLETVRHNGRDYHPIFSALSRLQTFVAKPETYLRMEGRALFEATKGANFVLNPKSTCGKELTASEIAFWLDPEANRQRAVIDKPTEILLGQPAEYPKKLVDALCMLFVNRSAVLAAHLLQIAFGDRDEPPHPLIGIEALGNWPKISAEVSELAAAIVPEMIIDLVPIDQANPNAVLSKELVKVPPFYKRIATMN
jgi:hypothetical protein